MVDRIDLPQGTLDLLILKTLALEPQHGWAISSAFSRSQATSCRCSKARCTRPCTGSSAGAGSRPSGVSPRTTAGPSITRSREQAGSSWRPKPEPGANSVLPCHKCWTWRRNEVMLTDLLYRLRAFFRRNAVEGELDEELRYHFDRQVEKW